MGLTAERLRELLIYDPETGVFTWRQKTGCKGYVGKVAGCIAKSEGRVSVGIEGRRYRAHRLAWLYVYGEWPSEVDHINGDGLDNRLSNLRLATRSDQGANTKRRRDNSSGIKGVVWHPQSRKWRVQIKRDVGLFATKEAAARAYIEAAAQRFGEFASDGNRKGRDVSSAS
jgi:hypothetical protein